MTSLAGKRVFRVFKSQGRDQDPASCQSLLCPGGPECGMTSTSMLSRLVPGRHVWLCLTLCTFPQERALLVINHVSYLDALVMGEAFLPCGLAKVGFTPPGSDLRSQAGSSAALLACCSACRPQRSGSRMVASATCILSFTVEQGALPASSFACRSILGSLVLRRRGLKVSAVCRAR